MKKTVLAFVMALGLATPALSQAVKVNVGFTPVIDYLGAFVAKDQGFFEKRGLDVTITQMPNSQSMPPALLADSLQVGAVTAPSLIQSKAGGFPIKIISGGTFVTKTNPNGAIVVRNGVIINSPADFIGKRVASGALGSYFNVLFRQWLSDGNVDPEKVTFVEVGFPQIGDVMRNGQIDAATIGQPFVSRIEAAGIGKAYSWFVGDFPEGLLSNVYTATEDWVANNPKAAKDFKEALVEANAFIKSNPDKSHEIAAKYLKLPPEAMKNVPFSNYSVDITDAQVKAWNDIMKKNKFTDVDVEAASVIVK
ncbi:ABC transporter substrate-binding protein [Rhizobium sp. BK060]|uniref:ABC transporter substrate-binding protein n=1 Tax=Rhizobium sp. BK060 TaxID=2587096 RepID=UPI00161FADB5|nr:ABC transporter substrate-binding protein [Rhizobium sp. BK060]MBB3396024.1 NitT/TauT family transport system substrate-binding protein [Rhizobium sp. BK060]